MLARLARRLSRTSAPAPIKPAVPDIPPDTRARFSDLAAWRTWWSEHPEHRDPAAIEAIVRHGLANGVQSAFLGPIGPDRVASHSPIHRESFHAADLNPRMRAILDLIAEHVNDNPFQRLGPRIYAHEAITTVAMLLRARYPRFIGSEYAATPAQADELFPIPAVDIARSPFPDGAFDLVVSNEVFEHVPDLGATIADTARILRPGGRLLATFPFAYDRDEPLVRAQLRDGEVQHLMEPEYHGNPTDPEGGSLVFQIPGWSVLDQAREAGFARAEILFWSSTARGITAAELTGILILDATRAAASG